MAELDPSHLLIPVLGCLILIILLLLLVLRLSSKVQRIQATLAALSQSNPGPVTQTQHERTSGGAFDEFLNEDSVRREMSKGEQFTAFRQWRKDKGMSWSASEGTDEFHPS